jgi:hypothetical protein
VYPSAPIPTFNLVGSFPFEEDSLPVCFVGDIFVFISNSNATVWNPIQDSWAQWRIDIIGETVRTVSSSCHISSELKYQPSFMMYNASDATTYFSS